MGIQSFLLAALLITSISLFSQESFSFSLVDKNSGAPVENAFIFIENTSIGTTTDWDGNATLIADRSDRFTLVITHLLYENISISSDDLSSTAIMVIEMAEKNLSLEEVVVKTKKTKPRNRKRWMKRFREGLLGNVSKRKVKILNPEALWFEETDTSIVAHAIDNIRIENNELGYEILFALDDFEISSKEDIRYNGKAFFKDISKDKKRTKIEKERIKTYDASQQLFFRSLVNNHSINPTLFNYGITVENGSGRFTFSQLSQDSLLWGRGVIADTLFLDGYLTVIKNTIRYTNHNNASGTTSNLMKPKNATSFLLSKTGQFIIGRDGTLYNQKEIEESGYWTNMRLAKRLPRDFEGPYYFEDEISKDIVDKFSKYQSQWPKEKAYLHIDKSTYIPYTTMWFKGYLVNANDHLRSINSDVLYVDLIGPDNELVNQWMIHRKKGFNGHYTWKGDDLPGRYTLRAYSNVMRNDSPESFYHQDIELIGLSNPESQEEEGSGDELIISFYPEGGDLINGLTQNVVFRVTDANGLPLEIEGSVLTKTSNNVVDNISTTHEGIGRFILTSLIEEDYYVSVNHNGNEYTFELPESRESGLSLTVNSIDKDDIYVTIESNSQDMIEGSFLLGHIRGQVFATKSNFEKQKTFKFSKSSIPAGIIHFTVFDAEERPQAERLVFNDYEVEVDYVSSAVLSTENSGGSSDASIEFTLADNIVPEVTDASLSITTINNDVNNNIKSQLLLQSDISTDIPNAAYYLNDIDNVKRYHLDLYLQSLLWRRFAWKDVDSQLTPTYKAEKSYTISGYTTKKGDTAGAQTNLMINSLGDELFVNQLTTKEDGSFEISDIPFLDTMQFIIQGRLYNGKSTEKGEKLKMKGNRLVSINIDDIFPTEEVIRKKAFLAGSNYVSGDVTKINTIRTAIDDLKVQDSSLWMLRAPEVSVTAQRNYRSNRPGKGQYFNLDYVDWVRPEANGPNLLSKLSPLQRYVVGIDSKLYTETTDFEGLPIRIPNQIIIDGMGAEPGGSNATRFLGLSADMIQTIAIGKGYVVITTRPITRTMEEYLESGILSYTHPGYSESRVFSEDLLTKQSEFINHTLLWEPSVAFDNNGKVSFTLPEEYVTKKVSISLEGLSVQGDIISHQKEIDVIPNPE